MSRNTEKGTIKIKNLLLFLKTRLFFKLHLNKSPKQVITQSQSVASALRPRSSLADSPRACTRHQHMEEHVNKQVDNK